MSTAYYDADDFYMLKSETNMIKIDVQIGTGLIGGFFVFNGTGLIGVNEDCVLRKNEVFSGSWITVSAVIKDEPGNEDWASVIVTLQEDSQIPKTFGPYRRKMDGNIDTVCYTFKIEIR